MELKRLVRRSTARTKRCKEHRWTSYDHQWQHHAKVDLHAQCSCKFIAVDRIKLKVMTVDAV
eukprot:5951669-Pleurochrysis_carterae.AAC.2